MRRFIFLTGDSPDLSVSSLEGIAEKGWCFSKIEDPLMFLRNFMSDIACAAPGAF